MPESSDRAYEVLLEASKRTARVVAYRFKAGDLVRVKPEDFMGRWRRPHLRTPGYIFGVIGTIERDCVVSKNSVHTKHVAAIFSPIISLSSQPAPGLTLSI